MNWFKELIIWFFKHLFFLFPINNKKVFFSNFNGKSFGDNPKYIFNELYKLHPDWKLIWWINDKNSPSPSHVKRVRNRISAIFHLSTSKVIVTNVKNLLPFIKKKKQFYLQTWHSALTYKPVEKDAEEYLNKQYVTESQKESKLTDAVIADNSLQVSKFNRCFYYNENTKILEFGTPKNDIYHNYTENDVIEFKKAIGVNPNSKLVVYAPTFRDNGDTSIYNLDFKAIVNAFNSNDKQDWVLLIRLHPNVIFNIDIKDNNIVNVSKFPDPQQIWIASDVIISDYSGVPFDFIEMNKPVFFYFPDDQTS